ncbi:undecaprenyl/decaprenyl-phosphate alpha-N-acetylglucosaminyl 1-phosphate transferase [Streptomyces sp. NPDC015220]|uniref:undecaprenyl/decaprenyl-phosphate alpha-N-acetylglucosaminyl 1-phosphate transferase n=1 Tax=Streptomyces sp. NPDC015220 TaxID=3364947 RepID=UPI0036FDC6A2
MLYGIATATAALLLAAVLSALFRVPALRLGLVDRRRVRPVPLLGGVAVVVSTCLVAAAGGWTGTAPLGEGVGRVLAAGAGVAVLGLVADVWRLRNRILLVGTAVAAAFVVPYDETGLLGGVAAVAWIACVAAAFRGLDHADGVAGTVGVLTAFGAGACAAAEMMDDLAVLLSILAAALTGFLMHNWHPARIAFGACGSLFTGFVLAASAVLVRTGYDPGPTAAVLFALTATASVDAVLVVLSRRLAGRPVRRRGPDHLAHRLRRLGLTPPGAAVVPGAATFAAVLVGVLVHTGWLAPTGALWTAGVALAAVLGLLRVRVYGTRRPAGARGGGTGAHRHTGFHTLGTTTSATAGARTSADDAYGTRSRADGRNGGPALRLPGGRKGSKAPGVPRGPGADPRGGTRGEAPRGEVRGGVRGDVRGEARGEVRAQRMPGDARSGPGQVPRAQRFPSAERFPSTPQPPQARRGSVPDGPRRSSEHPVPPPQQSASSQLRESLRVRDG